MCIEHILNPIYSVSSFRITLITVSYAPKKIAPPNEIHVVRAMPPLNSVFTPSSCAILRILEGMDNAEPLEAGSVGLGWADWT